MSAVSEPLVQVKYVEANGVRFGYFEEGQGPLVVLLHGFPDSAYTWGQVRPALARAGFRAVSPFMRGYAPTTVPADGRYHADALGKDVLELIPALGEKQAIVVGHDWGATAAYNAASLGPERVRFLVTVAIPHPASLLPSPRMLWGVRHFFRLTSRDAEAFVRKNDFEYVDVLLRRWSPAWNVPAGETRAVKEIFRQPGCVEAAVGYYRANGFETVPRSMKGKRITMPSAVFSGEDDGILRLSDYEKARRFYEAGCEIVHMPGGHFMHREHPERFITELLRVLRG